MAKTDDKGLQTLKVWQLAMKLAVKVCKEVLPMLPLEEKWALSSQIRRAAQSVPANIAEGYGRYYYQESIRFCYIARGSLQETYSHLALASQLGYLSPYVSDELNGNIDELLRTINGYIQFLKQCKRGELEPGSQITIHEPPPTYQINEAEFDQLPIDQYADEEPGGVIPN